MEIKRETRLYSQVILDIANHCNHRCRFCYNTFGEEYCLSRETFHKILQILPYTQDEHFYLSCLYEPSMNPLFFEMVAQIPRQFKNKACVTTNLDGEYSEADITVLAQSHLHHVEVSLPSFEKEQYCQLTGSLHARCLENVYRLRSAIDQNANRTRLQLHTMVLKSNYAEIVPLVKRAHEELRPYAHVLNTPQIVAEGENVLVRAKKDVRLVEEELLSREELNRLQDELMGLGYKNLIYILGYDAESYAHKKEVGAVPPDVQNDAYAIYISANGQGFFMKDENPFDLADIEHPFVFFSQALLARQSHQAAISEVHAPPPAHDHTDDLDFFSMLDAVTVWDERFVQLRGWAFHKQVASGPLYILVKTQDRQVVYLPQSLCRADVAAQYELEDTEAVRGFDCVIDPRVLPYTLGQKYEVHVGVSHEGALYTKLLTELSF